MKALVAKPTPLANMESVDQMASLVSTVRWAGVAITVTMSPPAFLGSTVVRMADAPSRALDASVTLVGMVTCVTGPCALCRVSLGRVMWLVCNRVMVR